LDNTLLLVEPISKQKFYSVGSGGTQFQKQKKISFDDCDSITDICEEEKN
jgi:hypothetical protein